MADPWQGEESCKRVEIVIVGEHGYVRSMYVCLEKWLLPRLCPRLAVPSQSIVTSHTCELSTRLQTLSRRCFCYMWLCVAGSRTSQACQVLSGCMMSLERVV
jgi:hypothetical protein